MVTLYRAIRRNSERPVDKPRQEAQESSSKQRIVPAANFCGDCGKIVEVGLEITAEGLLVAEHRSGCSSCEGGQQRRVL